MTTSFDDGSWSDLLQRIEGRDCTPFIGAGVSPHPKAAAIAEEWAKEFNYPLADRTDLARVAQFVTVGRDGMVDGMVPKSRLLRLFEKTQPPDYHDPVEPHGLLADLPFPLYLTTNYDGFMVDALLSRNRDPARHVCRWNDSLPKITTSKQPTVASPWVFHLHGSDQYLNSIVLTEDDYLDFLVRSQRDSKMLPHQIVAALSSTSLLFIGYSLADWTFRVLFRGIVYSLPNSLQRIHVAVQLPQSESQEQYLSKYFQGMKVRVYWGDATQFVNDLRERWDAYAGPPQV